MDFLELVHTRQSVRAYLDRPVEPEKLDRCLEAARLAPSASNGQPWKFIVVDAPALKEKVARATRGPGNNFNRFAGAAPVLVVLVLERMGALAQIGAALKGLKWNLIDLGIAAEHFCLAAAEQGIGTCMMGWFDNKSLKQLLCVPAGRRIGLVIAAGYAAEPGIRPKNRKPGGEIISRNSYK